MILRSRTLLPLCGPPVENGGIAIEHGRIVAVGPFHEVAAGNAGPVQDLGDAVLMPGLVNAHCHLDYTGMAGMIARPRTFPDWIKSILTLKSGWSDADFEASWHAGARQLLETGTTTVANIEAFPKGLPERRAATPLRVHSFIELTGVRSQREPESLVADAVAALAECGRSRGTVGLSPHAPYSTVPQLLRATARVAREHGWRITTHLAESLAEFEMFMFRRGPMFDWLHGQRPCDDCGRGSPVRHASDHGLLGPDFLAVHANYLWNDDDALLASSGSSVVHCPRSHDYFRHQRFPFSDLAKAGVNLCLGTDSLASARTDGASPPTLSLFEDMAMFASRDATVSPEAILRLATGNGARALGLAGVVGELSPGALADVIALPHSAGLRDVFDGIIHHVGPVQASMIGGEWVRKDGKNTGEAP